MPDQTTDEILGNRSHDYVDATDFPGVHDYSTGELPGPEDQTWDTAELQRDFNVQGFAAPYVLVTRKSDGVSGILQFNHSPRVYFNFVPD